VKEAPGFRRSRSNPGHPFETIDTIVYRAVPNFFGQGAALNLLRRYGRNCLAVLISCLGIATLSAADTVEKPVWKAGVAAVDVTPAEPMWMAGYASRTKPSAGITNRLSAKALAVEDDRGTRLVIVTLDLIGIPRAMRDVVTKRAAEQHAVSAEAVMFNASHTHSGPVVRSGGSVMYDLAPEEARKVEDYNAGLQDKLVGLIGAAIADLAPANVSYSHARAGFAMNRRLPTDKGVQNSPYPEGPVDHAVPVLRVESPDGKLRAIAFGYACHNTTLGLFDFCGDYAGFAQEYLEEAHPGAKALFVMGCGGDQNPYPRGTVELARQHGRTLATAVEAALLPAPKQLRGSLKTDWKDVELEFANPLNREALIALQATADKLDQRKAALLLEDLAKTGKIQKTYSYPVQVVRFGDDLTLIALAGETVVDFSLRLKRELPGSSVWVAGYSNDVFGYVPSRRVLEEGGYEAGGAMKYTRLPGPFAPNVEEIIVDAVHQLVKQK
jgi:neutral ceramidase